MDRAWTTTRTMGKTALRPRIRRTANATMDKVALSSATLALTPDALNRIQEILG
jgi:hypothetical protein